MASKNKVLLVSPAHPSNDPRIVYKYIPTLANEVAITCLLAGPKPARLPSTVHFARLPRFKWLGWRLLFVHPLIAWHIISIRPHTLHIFMPELLPLALLCKFAGIRVFYDVQENLRLKFDRKTYNNHWVFQQAFAVFDKLARRHCYCIFTEDSYLSTYTNLALPSAVIHNFPDVAYVRQFLQTDQQPASQDLVYLGLISIDRGLDTMISVMALLTVHYPDIRLHLFGRCLVTADQLEAHPDYALVKLNLIFYGQTDHAVALPIAARCLVGLALLKPVGDYPESYPTKVFEYMALGLPVIASDFPLYRSVINVYDCGSCVDPSSSTDIASLICGLINNPKSRLLQRKKGQLAVEKHFSWQKEEQYLLDLYKYH